jgi:hypothetical protein
MSWKRGSFVFGGAAGATTVVFIYRKNLQQKKMGGRQNFRR